MKTSTYYVWGQRFIPVGSEEGIRKVAISERTIPNTIGKTLEECVPIVKELLFVKGTEVVGEVYDKKGNYIIFHFK